MAEGPRDQILWLRDEMEKYFLIKKAEAASSHTEDLKEAFFLHRHTNANQTFHWNDYDPKELSSYLDLDWADERETRTSTSGDCNTLATTIHAKNEIKHRCGSQPTIALSPADAKIRAVVRGVVEGLCAVHLLAQHNYVVNWTLHFDSTAVIVHLSRLGSEKLVRPLESVDPQFQQI